MLGSKCEGPCHPRRHSHYKGHRSVQEEPQLYFFPRHLHRLVRWWNLLAQRGKGLSAQGRQGE